METATIDHASLARLVLAGGVKDTQVVVRQGGWAVVVHSMDDGARGPGDVAVAYTLATHRRGARLFKKMDSLVSYLTEIGISHFQVDAGAYLPGKMRTWSRPDRTAALKKTYADAAHDQWVGEQIDERIRMADAPDAVWVAHDDVKQRWAIKRAELESRIAGDKV